MVSYSWNQGVQMYRQLDESEARGWLNVAINMLRKSREQCAGRLAYLDDEVLKRVGAEGAERVEVVRGQWEQMQGFL